MSHRLRRDVRLRHAHTHRRIRAMVNDHTPRQDPSRGRIAATTAARAWRFADFGTFVASPSKHRAHLRTPRSAAAGALLLGCLFAAACSENVPIAPPVEEPFSMWGILNPTADTQAVILYPVVPGLLQPLGPEPLDAAVTSRDLASGDVRVWRDSVMTDGEAGYSHVFWSDFRAGYGRTYEIEAVRPDGARSSVTVRVPENVTIEMADRGRRHMDVHFRGEGAKLMRIEMTYAVRFDEDVRTRVCRTDFPIYHYTLSYLGEETQQAGGWHLPVNLGHFYQVLKSFYDDDYPMVESLWAWAEWMGYAYAGLSLLSLRLDVTVADESWNLPPGLLDVRDLTHPWSTTNVENGFGFVNAGYRRAIDVEPRPSTVRDAEFGYCDEDQR